MEVGAGIPTFATTRIVCTGETYKSVVRMTFARVSAGGSCGPLSLLLKGTTRRAIDFHVGEKINEKALIALVRAALDLNGAKAKRWSVSAAESPGRLVHIHAVNRQRRPAR